MFYFMKHHASGMHFWGHKSKSQSDNKKFDPRNRYTKYARVPCIDCNFKAGFKFRSRLPDRHTRTPICPILFYPGLKVPETSCTVVLQ